LNFFFKGYDQQTAGPFQAWHFLKNNYVDMNSTILIRSVRSFFDLRTTPLYKKSRIKRRPTKIFEEFIFKGYDQQTPGLSRPGYFKPFKMICKN
jgi:hypothetical protein